MSINTLLLIDVFHMKNINASYGFKNGDAILKQLKKLIKSVVKYEINNVIACLFKNHVRTEVYRHYSDVIALLIHEDLPRSAILQIKDIILQRLLTHQFIISNPRLNIHINITIGCSKSNEAKLLIIAEKALHHAKANLDSFLFFDENFYLNESTNNNLVELIKYNIDNRTVEPYFQAIMSNKDNTVIKYEALMRLFDKEGNVLPPAVFLEKAKNYRLYVELMKILINKTFDIIVKHQIDVSINLEYNDMINPIIRSLIIERIKAEDIGRHLTIEILESERIQDFEAINSLIHKLKKYSISIAIDDFGTGFSNYENILKLHVDYLKIDGSLIQRIDEEIYMSLIKSIVMFCKQQNIFIIAEFVTDIKTQRYVESLEIDYSQGYYIQKPMKIAHILEMSDEK